jgi:archaellum biogenesis protein FlaJ (TadC family)
MAAAEQPERLNALDRGLSALFAQHADASRHDQTRQLYRAADLGMAFEVFLARAYGLGWIGGLTAALGTIILATVVPGAVFDAAIGFLHNGIPVVNRLNVPPVSRVPLGLGGAVLVGAAVRLMLVRLSRTYLRGRVRARRADIEATLPGAVRYLRVLASGEHDQRAMLAQVANQTAYGETAVEFQRALNRAALTGSLDDGLERVASETPSRDLLAPFLLKFREHANQGAEALEGYLEMEGRLLSHQQSRRQERATGYLELLAELFVVLLVMPALLVLIVTVMGVLSPGLSAPVATPLGTTTVRATLIYGSAAFVLAAGGAAAFLVTTIRPSSAGMPAHERPETLIGILATADTNPCSAVTVLAPVGILTGVGLTLLGYRTVNVVLLAYAAVGLPVGLVALRRARIDDAKDKEIQDFVHAVSGHVSLGRPFGDAVAQVAREVDLGPLHGDVDDLAFTLGLTTSPDSEDTDGRAAALNRFVESVGTRMADQTIGLVVGALRAGSDAEDVFETLQTEIGQLYHQRKSLRSALLVYVAVGWTTALLVVGIVIAVNAYVLEGFSQLSTIAGSQAMTLDPQAIDPARDQYRFYVVTQATMLACGWFAGTASRGYFEALLHSSALVTIAYVVFAGVGMI